MFDGNVLRDTAVADTWGETSKSDNWDNTEADENFWGSDNIQTQSDWSIGNKNSDWPGGTKDSDWSTGNKNSDWPIRKKDSDWTTDIQPGPSNETKSDLSVETKQLNLPTKSSRSQENDNGNCTGRQDSVSQSTCINQVNEKIELTNNNSMSLDRRTGDTITRGYPGTKNGRLYTKPDDGRDLEQDSSLCEKSNVPCENNSIPQEYNPLSKEDEDEGNLFVIDDSDSDCEMKRKYSELPWQPVVKKDPFFVKEDLNLLLEEVRKIGRGKENRRVLW